MAISNTVKFENHEKLFLDPMNPRLGRRLVDSNPSQNKILKWMNAEGDLDELAISFVENGFWTQEAIVVVEEKLGKKKEFIVVEGNRRLAAIKMLWLAKTDGDVPKKWFDIANDASEEQMDQLKKIPYVLADSRSEVQAYLGFRHVSGIKEWNPAEKAEFIAHLIDDEKLTYKEVMKKIGSKTPTVRQNYISYRILLQMEDQDNQISIDKVEDRFSVLFLSLRTVGVKTYLNIDIQADSKKAKNPVPQSKLEHLERFACWLFGNENVDPLVKDSRQTDDFGKILENPKAVAYLERTAKPNFETAFRMAGGEEFETIQHIERAADEVEEALSTAHLHKKSKNLKGAVDRLGRDVLQLLEFFPDVKDELLAEK